MSGEIGYPFQGQVWYAEETTYADDVSTTFGGTCNRFSDSVDVCRLESGDVNKTLKNIGSEKVTDFVKTMVDPRLHVEYVWQPHTGSTISDFVTRTTGDLKSFGVEFEASGDRTNSSYYQCVGCVADTVNVSASTGEEYVITIDFSVASVYTPNSTTGSDPGAIGTTLASFNKAGTIKWSTGADTYYVTKSLDVTVENNLNDYWDVGSTSKKACIPGAKDVTGSVDISMDEGGSAHWNRVTAGTDIASVQFDSECDASTYDVIKISNLRFDSTAIEQNTSGEGMFDSVSFTAKDLSFLTATT